MINQELGTEDVIIQSTKFYTYNLYKFWPTHCSGCVTATIKGGMSTLPTAVGLGAMKAQVEANEENKRSERELVGGHFWMF